jgi:hypothetical protein
VLLRPSDPHAGTSIQLPERNDRFLGGLGRTARRDRTEQATCPSCNAGRGRQTFRIGRLAAVEKLLIHPRQTFLTPVRLSDRRDKGTPSATSVQLDRAKAWAGIWYSHPVTAEHSWT